MRGNMPNEAVERIARIAGVKTPVVEIVSALEYPACSTVRGKILLRSDTVSKLSGKEFDAVMAHEVAHIALHHSPYRIGWLVLFLFAPILCLLFTSWVPLIILPFWILGYIAIIDYQEHSANLQAIKWLGTDAGVISYLSKSNARVAKVFLRMWSGN